MHMSVRSLSNQNRRMSLQGPPFALLFLIAMLFLRFDLSLLQLLLRSQNFTFKNLTFLFINY